MITLKRLIWAITKDRKMNRNVEKVKRKARKKPHIPSLFDFFDFAVIIL
jgi:hypothetical protein